MIGFTSHTCSTARTMSNQVRSLSTKQHLYGPSHVCQVNLHGFTELCYAPSGAPSTAQPCSVRHTLSTFAFRTSSVLVTVQPTLLHCLARNQRRAHRRAGCIDDRQKVARYFLGHAKKKKETALGQSSTARRNFRACLFLIFKQIFHRPLPPSALEGS